MTADHTAQTPQPPAGGTNRASVGTETGVTLTEAEWEPIDGALIALWQAETEKGMEFGADRVRRWAERLVAARVDAALGEVDRRISTSVSPNFALNHNGTEDSHASAYVEGLHDALTKLAEQYEEQARQEDYGGELWSTTAAALRALLAEHAPTSEPTRTEDERDVATWDAAEAKIAALRHQVDDLKAEVDQVKGLARNAVRDVYRTAAERRTAEQTVAALTAARSGDREALGRRVREVWVEWAREQDEPKPSWLVGWDDLGEPDREVDRRIGETLHGLGVAAHAQVIERLEAELADRGEG